MFRKLTSLGLTCATSSLDCPYLHLRLEQREWQSALSLADRLRAGQRALAYTRFILGLSAILGVFGVTPALVFLPYLLQFAETAWGTLRPAVGARQFVPSILFTLAFVIVWR